MLRIGKLPIGIQSFDSIRRDGFIYVDKTEYIYRLVHEGKPYFLSRPRRFGKSLLISTLKAYWEGRKDLFKGLAIERLEKDNPDAWRQYPVFCFDFNGTNYQEEHALEHIIEEQLDRYADIYGLKCGENEEIGKKFRKLMTEVYLKTGLRCVVLVDEYDKPLLEVMEDRELLEHNKAVFKGFFSTLKGYDGYLQFVFITGVSKFHKVSIFSDLNQLNDISLDESYASMCGITEAELKADFDTEIAALSERRRLTKGECLARLKELYDGYRFHPDADGVYNPFSLLRVFFTREFGSYWFETGTPTFLVKRLKDMRFDVRKFTNRTIYASESTLRDYTGDLEDPVPLLYQSGYLTIAGYDERIRRYTLCFPNEEVEYGFLESLLPLYIPKATAGYGLDIFTLCDYVEGGDTDRMRDVLTALFANITYTLRTDPFEHYFQAVIYLVFTLLGRFSVCEMHTYTGRVDCKVETNDYIYLFEFKCDEDAKTALSQIDSKDYSLPFIADSRKLFKIGVSFDVESRKLVGWEVA